MKLTRGEYAICEYLALHSGQTFSKEQIYEAVFGFDAPGDQAAVTEHIKNIRAKLRALDCHPIDTVWGVGYRWKRDLHEGETAQSQWSVLAVSAQHHGPAGRGAPGALVRPAPADPHGGSSPADTGRPESGADHRPPPGPGDL